MKKSSVAKNIYGFEVSSQVISNLTNWAQFGKNANIVLNLAKIINTGADLPTWFNACFDIEHAQELFSLPTARMKKVLEKDTYFIIRNCVNTYLKNKELTDEQKSKLKKVLTNVVFQNNAALNTILNFKPEPSLLSDNKTAQAVKNTTAPAPAPAPAPAIISTNALNNAPAIDTDNAEVFVLADEIAKLDLDNALKIQALLEQHIASLQAAQAQKVA